MGGGVLFQIDGADGHFPDGNAQAGGCKQHVGFELIPVAGDCTERPEKVGADGPQSGLGIRYPYAAQHPETPDGRLVPDAAAQRHVDAVKLPHPQHQTVRVGFQFPGTAQGVGSGVLSVAVHGHHAEILPGVFQKPWQRRS